MSVIFTPPRFRHGLPSPSFQARVANKKAGLCRLFILNIYLLAYLFNISVHLFEFPRITQIHDYPDYSSSCDDRQQDRNKDFYVQHYAFVLSALAYIHVI